MEKYIINGGNKLYGSVEVQTAKNSVLPILAATVLTDDKVKIFNVPNITDAKNMVKILSGLGCRVAFEGNDLVVDGSFAKKDEIPRALAHELRSSVFLLGSIISRLPHCKNRLPRRLRHRASSRRFALNGFEAAGR